MFCRIRGYLSTCRKQGMSATQAMALVFEGKLPDCFVILFGHLNTLSSYKKFTNNRLILCGLLISLFDPGVTQAALGYTYWNTFINRGNAFSAVYGWVSQDKYPRFLGDVNGDGLDDIVGLGYNNVFVSKSNGDGFDIYTVATLPMTFARGYTSNDSHPRMMGDVNGDGKDDLIGFDGVYIKVALSNGIGFNSPYTAGSVMSHAAGWLSNETHPRIIADVNGDGKDDIVGFGYDSVYVVYSDGLNYQLAVNVGDFLTQKYGWTSQDEHPRLAGDINGDGKDDIVGFGYNKIYVAFSNGNDFNVVSTIEAMTSSSGWESNDKTPRFIVDVNGDGQDDILGFGENQIYVAISDGNTFLKKYPASYGRMVHSRSQWPSNDLTVRLVGNLDSDNKVDLFGISNNGIVTSFSTSEPVPSENLNPIVKENLKSGTSEWRLKRNSGNSAIKGYASEVSINKGDTIDFHISLTDPQAYDIDIYRLGWYGGKGGRFIVSIPDQLGIMQNSCLIAAGNIDSGTVICPWNVSYTLQVQNDWTTGVYLAKLTQQDGKQNYISFVVRDDYRVGDFLYHQPVNTYQAYNSYPQNASLTDIGKSLYASNSSASSVLLSVNNSAVKVSFDRPYNSSGAGQIFAWEYDTILWLESEGYDVSYLTNLDVHKDPEIVNSFSGFISPGHDEYWTSEMYTAVENARDVGVDLAFLGSNAAYWQSRYEDNDRALVCYKQLSDPVSDTTRFRVSDRSEQSLIGVQYIDCCAATGNTDLIIQVQTIEGSNDALWLFENTGLQNGDTVSGLVGYEVDTRFTLGNNYGQNFIDPIVVNWNLLSASPYKNITANSSIYKTISGSYVFGSGTMSWSWGLHEYSETGLASRAIQLATKNLFDKFLLTP